jgi:hypothetical protein
VISFATTAEAAINLSEIFASSIMTMSYYAMIVPKKGATNGTKGIEYERINARR